jgi:hypothetical protein
VGTALGLAVLATGHLPPAHAEPGLLPGGLPFADEGSRTASIAGTWQLAAALTALHLTAYPESITAGQ